MTLLWSDIAEKKQKERDSRIPDEWRLAKPILSIDAIETHLSEAEIEITRLSAHELGDRMKKGKYSVRTVVSAFCHRATLAHFFTNCLTEILFDEALKLADELDALPQSEKESKPLFGIPMTIKDSFNIEGVDSSIGYIAFAFAPAENNATLYDTLIQCGGVIIAKTNVPQTLMPNDSHNNVWGRTLNPCNTECTPGGSSGGEGAVVACRGSPLGFGTDIAGSVRIPALCCGLYGLRPSDHRLPFRNQRAPCSEAAALINPVLGPITHDPVDLRLSWNALIAAEPWKYDDDVLPIPLRHVEPAPKTFKVGYIKQLGDVPPHPPVLRAIDMTLKALQAQGHEIIELTDFPQDVERLDRLSGVLLSLDAYESTLDIIQKGNEPVVDSVAKLNMTDLPPHSSKDIVQAIADRQVLQEECRKCIRDNIPGDYDIFITPAAPHTAVQHDLYFDWSYSVLFNALDWPAVAIPVTRVDPSVDLPRSLDLTGKPEHVIHTEKLWDPEFLKDLPVAVQIVGKRNKEEELIESVIATADALKAYHPQSF